MDTTGRYPLISGQYRIADQIRALGREAGVSERVRLRHRDRHSGLHDQKAATLQSFTSADYARRVLAAPFAHGKIPDVCPRRCRPVRHPRARTRSPRAHQEDATRTPAVSLSRHMGSPPLMHARRPGAGGPMAQVVDTVAKRARPRIGRRRARGDHDHHGARSHARLLRHARPESHQSGHAPRAALFLTRWITHFCAPVFFLLTGTGAYLSLRRRTPARAVALPAHARALADRPRARACVRCLAYQFNVDYRVTMLLVLWALGWAMITLSALVRLPAGRDRRVSVCCMIAGTTCSTPCGRRTRSGRSCTRPGSSWPHPHARRVRGLSAGSLGRRHRRRASPSGRSMTGPASAAAAFLLRLGLALTRRSSCSARLNVYGDPSRWTRSQTRALHGAVVPQHDQVSAVAAVPADDAGAGAAPALGGGPATRRACFGRR